MKELLRELCTLDGVAGYEDEVREVIMQKVAPYAAEMTVDMLILLIGMAVGMIGSSFAVGKYLRWKR